MKIWFASIPVLSFAASLHLASLLPRPHLSRLLHHRGLEEEEDTNEEDLLRLLKPTEEDSDYDSDTEQALRKAEEEGNETETKAEQASAWTRRALRNKYASGGYRIAPEHLHFAQRRPLLPPFLFRLTRKKIRRKALALCCNVEIMLARKGEEREVDAFAEEQQRERAFAARTNCCCAASQRRRTEEREAAARGEETGGGGEEGGEGGEGEMAKRLEQTGIKDEREAAEVKGMVTGESYMGLTYHSAMPLFHVEEKRVRTREQRTLTEESKRRLKRAEEKHPLQSLLGVNRTPEGMRERARKVSFYACAARYDAEKALWCAYAACLAYEKADFVKHVVLDIWGWDEMLYVRSKYTDSQAFLMKKGNVMLVAFCGTKSLKNWGTNLAFRPFRLPKKSRHVGGFLVHYGFTKAFLSLMYPFRTFLMDSVAQAGEDEEIKIYLTGHSLGGALATLGYAHLMLSDDVSLQDRGFHVEALYTFGQPAVGSKAFKVAINTSLCGSAYYRFTNNKDPVPLLPGPPYSQCGCRIYIQQDQTLVLAESESALRKLREQEKTPEVPTNKEERRSALRAHSMIQYLIAVEKNFQEGAGLRLLSAEEVASPSRPSSDVPRDDNVLGDHPPNNTLQEDAQPNNIYNNNTPKRISSASQERDKGKEIVK
ncbi:putative zinc finger protein on ecdysone puffs [Balamuthia mandrillaris]